MLTLLGNFSKKFTVQGFRSPNIQNYERFKKIKSGPFLAKFDEQFFSG